ISRGASDFRTRIERGATPLQKSGLAGIFFSWAGAVAARIGWIEVALLSVRIVGVSVGIGRGKIVDCGCCLGRFRLDLWGIVWGRY
ncbi:MAG: hypothetical protein WBG24_16415, partial [Syntrophobacteria bacterium]